MIRYTGTISSKGESRFLLDDADDVNNLPLGAFTWGGKTYQKPAAGSVAIVEETLQRYVFDGTKWSEAGGASSWNDLTDKPFGEMPTGGDTLTWDGDTEGLEGIDLLGVGTLFYKISDAFFPISALHNGYECRFMHPEGGELSLNASVPLVVTGNEGEVTIICDTENQFHVVSLNNDTETGTFFAYGSFQGIGYISYLTIPGYTGFPVTKTLDEKYLPGATVLYTDSTYLYNTEDTTDESNRTTKAELAAALNAGRAIYIAGALSETAVMFAPCIVISVVGDAWGAVAVTGDLSKDLRYTAEYTAS